MHKLCEQKINKEEEIISLGLMFKLISNQRDRNRNNGIKTKENGKDASKRDSPLSEEV